MPKAKFTGHVLVTILEHQDRGLVHLNGTVHVRAVGKVNIGFFTRADTATDFSDETTAEELEENHTCTRIEHLFHCGAISLVLGLIARTLL